jgi:hypothetical protein
MSQHGGLSLSSPETAFLQGSLIMLVLDLNNSCARRFRHGLREEAAVDPASENARALQVVRCNATPDDAPDLVRSKLYVIRSFAFENVL